MNISDILQVMALCALIFFPLGYLAHRYLSSGWRYWRNRLLRPRYLTSEGHWGHERTATRAKK